MSFVLFFSVSVRYVSVLDIWKAVGKKFLSAPPSSVQSERTFSKYGLIYENVRSRLLLQKEKNLFFSIIIGIKFKLSSFVTCMMVSKCTD